MTTSPPRKRHFDLAVPFSEYFSTSSRDSQLLRTRILDHLATRDNQKIVLYGSATTGLRVKEIIKDKFHSFVSSDTLSQSLLDECSAIFITTSPLHYKNIINRIAPLLSSRTELVTIFDNYTQNYPAKKTKEDIEIFTTQKAASSLLYDLTKQISDLGNLTHYANENGNFNDNFKYTTYNTLNYQNVFGPFREILRANEHNRTVIHIRDPRDILTSLFYSHAYNHAILHGVFTPTPKERGKWREDGIDKFVLQNAPAIHEKFRAFAEISNNKPKTAISKYEEMVNDFNNWITKFIGLFPIKGKREISHIMFERHKNSFFVNEENIHCHKRQITPGDHQRKLNKSTIKQLNIIFHDVLEQFGYL